MHRFRVAENEVHVGDLAAVARVELILSDIKDVLRRQEVVDVDKMNLTFPGSKFDICIS